jgi:membrane protein
LGAPRQFAPAAREIYTKDLSVSQAAMPTKRFQFGAQRFWDQIRAAAKQFWAEVLDGRLSNGAAILAFYMMLAVVPTAIFGLSSLKYLPIPSLEQAIFDLLQQVLPATAADLLRQTVQDVLGKGHPALLSFGLLFAVWSASTGLFAVMQQLNAVYGITERRPYWIARAISVALMLLFGLMVVLTFVLVIFGGTLQEWIGERLGWSPMLRLVFAVFRWLMILFFVLAAFAAMYRLGPNTEQPFRLFSAGSVCATLGLLVVSFGFKLYVSNFGSYDRAYGGLGAVIVLQLWLFIVGWMILLGGVVNDAVDRESRD